MDIDSFGEAMKRPVISSSLPRQPVLHPRKGQHLLRERRNQDGFALIAVLAVIAITAVTIGALLGMMLTAIKITENQQRDARQARVADGAVTAAINQLRMNQTNAVDACLPGVPAAAGLLLKFTSSERTDTATVTCRTAADELGASAGEIKLSGSEYQGAFLWKAWPWASLQPSINTAKPTLVHKGASALKFNGNLSSQGGAAPLRDPAGTPALDVRGGYEQASQGIGAAASPGGSCGALSGADVNAATTVRASAGTKCGAPLLVPVSATQDDPIDSSTPTSPDPSALTDCPASSVITFSPGKYDQNDVKTLNKWFGRGVGSCTNKTFYFPYGRYWFDANTVINGVGASNQHALTFDNPSSTFVFGKANGWDPAGAGAAAANFPKACDPASPGASIILSARTEFRHLAGRLAVCPYRFGTGATATPYPALLQQTTVPTKVTSVSAKSAATNPLFPKDPDFLYDSNLVSNDRSRFAEARFSCAFSGGFAPCTSSKKFTIALSSEVSGPISSASLNITGKEGPDAQIIQGVRSREAAISVTLADGRFCDVPKMDGAAQLVGGALELAGLATYELLAGEDCKKLITNGEQLNGASVSVTYKYQFACLLATDDGCPKDSTFAPRTLRIWNVNVVANPWVGSATSVAGTPAGEWENVDNVRLDKDTLTTKMTFCADKLFCLKKPVKPSIQLWDFGKFVGGTAGPNVAADASHLDSLGVVIKQLGAQQCPIGTLYTCAPGSFSGATVLTLTLNDAERTVCTKSFSGISNQAGDQYFPLLAFCGPKPQVASSLFGSSLKVEYQNLNCVLVGLDCWYFPPVPIQYVGLVATSDSYSGPVIKSQLTIDSAAAVPAGVAPGGPASANFFGSAYLKNVALDLNWNGQASGASLFGGELQLNSLGSLMKATATTDVVCCTAPETNIRKVRLTASVDNEAKLSAVVALNRDLPTAAPVVLEWTVCGRNGNCSP